MEIVNLIRDLFLSPFGSFASVLAFLALCFWAVVKITTINNNHSHLMEALKKHDSFIDNLRADIAYIKGNIELLKTHREDDIAQSHSPISLTEKGESLAQQLNIDFVISENWVKIKSDLDENVKDKNPYDIQEYCRQTAAVNPERFFSEYDIRAIKQEAFRVGRSFFELSIIPALKIRDKYLLEKGIAIEDIDKHDPNKPH